MTDEEKMIVRLALIFLLTELPLALDTFAGKDSDSLDLNGEHMEVPTEEDINSVLMTLQG